MNVSSMRRVATLAVCAVSFGLWGAVTVVDVKGDVEHSIPLTDVPSQHSWILPAIPRPPRHHPGVMRAECLATPDVGAVESKLGVEVEEGEEL